MHRRTIAVLLALILLPAPRGAAQAWEWLNPHPQGKDLYALHAAGGGTVYAGGSQGMLLRSTNGGSTWAILPAAPSNIRAITSLLNGTIFIAGEDGLLLKSTDGTAFSPVSSGTTADCNAIAFSGTTGIIATANGSVVVSTDAGSSWHSETTGLQGALATVYVTGNGTVLAGGYDGILASKSPGGSWVKTPLATTEIITGIAGSSNSIYAVTSGGAMYLSSNGGASWTLKYRGTGWFTSVTCFSGDTLAITGINGQLLRSTNGGADFSAAGTGSAIDWLASAASPEGILFICGERGALAASNNRTATWTILSNGETGDIRYLNFLDLNTGWAVGDHGLLLQTTDGGETWQKMNSGTVNALNCISFYKNWGLAAGDNGTLLETKDSGRTWTDKSAVLHVAGDLYTVYADYFNSRITGAEGILFESYNQGKAWNRISLSWQLNFRSFTALNIRIGMLVGDGGKIYRAYRYFGSTVYEPLSTDPVYDLRSVHAINDKMVWAVGKHGVVLRTTFGGWFTVMTHLNAEWLNAVHFLDSINGYCAGSEGKVFKSTDGGTSWRQLATGITNSLTGVFFKDLQNGWVTGAGGTILRTKTGGQEPLFSDDDYSSTSPAHTLACFPNPANDVLKVKIPDHAGAGGPLLLFNLLGEQVQALTEAAHAGSTVLMKTAGVPNGVYLLRHTSTGYSAKVLIRH